MIKWFVGGLLALGLFATGAQAQDETVAASNPEQMIRVLKDAGYTATLLTDSEGDPKITVKIGGWNVSILFYGCDETTHAGCDSLQFSTGMDRKTPMEPAAALALARQFRFISVFLDDEGDPYLQWDVLTGDGLPRGLFLQALRRYESVISDASEIIFPD